jgi:DNA-binding XRE family transcriptional regulator
MDLLEYALAKRAEGYEIEDIALSVNVTEKRVYHILWKHDNRQAFPPKRHDRRHPVSIVRELSPSQRQGLSPLGVRMRELMVMRAYTQEDVGLRAGISANAVSYAMRVNKMTQRQPTIGTCLAIAKALDVPLSELLVYYG